MKRYLALLALPLCLAVLTACSSDSDIPTPDLRTPTSFETDTPGRAQSETGASSTPHETPTAGQTMFATPEPSATLTPTTAATPASAPVATPLEVTLLTTEEAWVKDRREAVVSLYDITEEGARALGALDFRWMQDQPGFFGSFGYKSWTGVGEAKPKGVIHELGHAYWGLFPITGLPQLGWDTSGGNDVSPAMQRYHQDVLEFLSQPMDPWEPLRGRLRTLPEVSGENTEPIFHHIEADAVHTIAGDLHLLPPILRKYWDRLLRPGPFNSWEEALAWYMRLPEEEKKLADRYLGFEHLDLGSYDSLKSGDRQRVPEQTGDILVREERRRLQDFADLFDLLLGSPEHQENFNFWRAYMRDKRDLHERYPGLVSSLDAPRAPQIAAAMDTLLELKEKDRDEQAGLLITRLREQPFLVNFLPVLEDRVLLELFSSGSELPQGATLKGTAEFVESLEKFTPHINRIIDMGTEDAGEGAKQLTAYLNGVDFEEKDDLKLFFDILRDSDESTGKEVVAALDDSMLRRLLEPVPAKLRSLLDPPRLLEFLNITLDSTHPELVQGMQDMITFPSGNFRIDEPFIDEMYSVIAIRSRMEAAQTLSAIAGSAFPVERFLSLHPAAAVDLLSTDLDITTAMVKSSDPVILPPAKFVYRLIYADPEFAARVVQRLDRQGEDRLVLESLAHFAYDADRLRAVPGLPISLERDGRFLKGLLEDNGPEWLEQRMEEVVEVFQQRIVEKLAPGDFLAAYKRTLEAAASIIEDGEAGRTLEEITTRVLG